MYVVTIPTTLGAEIFAQAFTPAVPLIDQLNEPPGATAPVFPVTVAVNISDPPSEGSPDEVRAIIGVA